MGQKLAKNEVSIGLRILALLLIVGGIVGVLIAGLMVYQFLQAHWIYLLLIAAFIALFLWSALTGLRLWRGEQRGLKWATTLFAMQIPVLTVPGLEYEFYTGLAVKLMGGNVESGFLLAMGASGSFYLDTTINDWVYGINLLALVAVIYLVLHRRTSEASSTDEA